MTEKNSVSCRSSSRADYAEESHVDTGRPLVNEFFEDTGEPWLEVGSDSAHPWEFSHGETVRKEHMARHLERIHSECHDRLPGPISFKLQKIKRDRIRFATETSDPSKMFYLRLYHFRGNWSWILALRRTGRALHEQRVAEWLDGLDVPFPEIVACNRLHLGGVPVGSYLIQKHLAGWVSVKSILSASEASVETFRSMDGFERLGAFHWRLFENGGFLTQVGTGHLLLPGPDSPANFGMMDHEHTILVRPPVPPAERFVLLAKLDKALRTRRLCTREDRARMFRAYVERDPAPELRALGFDRFDAFCENVRLPSTPLRSRLVGYRLMRAHKRES